MSHATGNGGASDSHVLSQILPGAPSTSTTGESKPVADSLNPDRHASALVRVWCAVPEKLRDLFWPSTTPSTPAELARESKRDAESLELDISAIDAWADVDDDVALRAAADALQRSVEGERDRRSSVEARLTTVLGMVSVAASVAFGALTAVFNKGFQGVASVSAFVGVAVMLYAVLQLVNGLLAALRGLARTGYLEALPAEFLRRPTETTNQHLRRQMHHMVRARAQHAEANSRKVETMDVAHTALHHFVVAVLILSVFMAAAMIIPGRDAPDRALIAKLRSDPALMELLRGPRGAPGAAGAQGPSGGRGATGERGPQGPPGVPTK